MRAPSLCQAPQSDCSTAVTALRPTSHYGEPEISPWYYAKTAFAEAGGLEFPDRGEYEHSVFRVSSLVDWFE